MDLEQRRLALHEIFCTILGSRYVYFQPPANIQMVYPCIVYGRDRADAKFANNTLYSYKQRYQVKLIGLDPDGTSIFEAVLRLQYCEYDRSYATDNLNHDVFNLYF